MHGTTKILTAIAGSAMALAAGIGPASAVTTHAGAARSGTAVTPAQTRQVQPQSEWWVYQTFPYTNAGIALCNSVGTLMVSTNADGVTAYYCIQYPPNYAALYVN